MKPLHVGAMHFFGLENLFYCFPLCMGSGEKRTVCGSMQVKIFNDVFRRPCTGLPRGQRKHDRLKSTKNILQDVALSYFEKNRSSTTVPAVDTLKSSDGGTRKRKYGVVVWREWAESTPRLSRC